MWRQPKTVWSVAFACVVAFMGIGLVDPILKPIAEELGATPAQLAIAFTLTHPATATTLFGASSVAQLEANLGSLELLGRIGAETIRERVTPFWADRDVVDPEGP